MTDAKPRPTTEPPDPDEARRCSSSKPGEAAHPPGPGGT
ncbi:MAG: hypothetical protein AVDCRST_MAG71-754 [uncultured Lysobacter sp.]|uniref:Uncharacterized protein n=1 Tax=uncultured Lysobacter sp. TaxID=271060 RepID=A0A6J4KRE9_9GAMM|nr:MAG: hypothetical protein AVDCRST_MAG71-754 [uncultured Lysobacter sp.]